MEARIFTIIQCVLRVIYNIANQSAVTEERPTTVHPVRMTCLFDSANISRVKEMIPMPVSHIRCRMPLIEWNAKGKAMALFNPTFAATGSEPNAAAIVGTSRCHPNNGETRYAAPNVYTPNTSVLMTNGIYFQIRFRQWFWSKYWGLRWFELNRLTNGD